MKMTKEQGVKMQKQTNETLIQKLNNAQIAITLQNVELLKAQTRLVNAQAAEIEITNKKMERK